MRVVLRIIVQIQRLASVPIIADFMWACQDQEFESTSRDFSAQALGADLAKEA